MPGAGATTLSGPVIARGLPHLPRMGVWQGTLRGCCLSLMQIVGHTQWATCTREAGRVKPLPWNHAMPPTRSRYWCIQGAVAPKRRRPPLPGNRCRSHSRAPSIARKTPLAAIGTALAITLLRHRASCLPYAPLASREAPRVRLDRTQLSRQIRHKKPDFPTIGLAGMSGFFYSWREVNA